MVDEKLQLPAVMQKHDIEWENKGTHEKHLSVLNFAKKEREKEVLVLEQEVSSSSAESAVLTGKIAENKADIQVLDEVREETEKAVEWPEKAERQVEIYEKELDVIKPVMESTDQKLKEFRGKIEDKLPPVATLERASSYRGSKGEPLFIKMKNKIAALAARLMETMQELNGFCMLEEDGMTIEIMVDEVSYMFTCSMEGDIIGVERTDGNRFDLKDK